MTARPDLVGQLQGAGGPGIKQRFWSFVDKRSPDECWEWTAARHPDGYGMLTIRPGGGRRAHRISFLIAYGWLPDAVLHKCDNRPCVNPRHLFGGTLADNRADAAAKGRLGKVTLAVRATILALHEDGMTYSAIGRQLGLSRTAVSCVVRRAYREVES